MADPLPPPAAALPPPGKALPLIELGLSEEGPRAFYRALLDGALRASGCRIGAAFSLLASGSQETGVRLEDVLARDGEPLPFSQEEIPSWLLGAVRKSAATGRTTEIYPKEGTISGLAWVVIPLKARNQISAVLALARTGEDSPKQIEAGMRWLHMMTPAVSVRALVTEREELGKRLSRLDLALGFLAGLVGDMPMRELAIYIVNGLRELIDCDRVTLLRSDGERWTLLTVSGAESVEPGSELVAALRDAFAEVANEQPYALHDLSSNPPETGCLGRLWDVIPGNHLCLLAKSIEDPGQPGARFGLLFESSQPRFFRSGGQAGQGENQPLRTALWIVERISPALLACARRERLPLRPWIGKWEQWQAGGRDVRNRRRRLAWLAAFGLLALLMFLPWQEHASGDCNLLPRSRAVVASEVDGRLREVLIREGALVEVGQPLARLETRPIETELAVAQQERLRQEAEAQRLQGLGEMGNYRVVTHEVDRLRRLEERLSLDIERSTLRAPIRGVIVTKDVDLRKGEVLPLGQEFCEIAALEDWDLRIAIPEAEIGLLLKAIERRGELPVRYVLEARSDLHLETALRSVEQISQIANSDARRNLFQITLPGIDLPKELRQEIRPGYSGRARIQMERHPLGIVLFRRFAHFLRMHWIF